MNVSSYYRKSLYENYCKVRIAHIEEHGEKIIVINSITGATEGYGLRSAIQSSPASDNNDQSKFAVWALTIQAKDGDEIVFFNDIKTGRRFVSKVFSASMNGINTPGCRVYVNA